MLQLLSTSSEARNSEVEAEAEWVDCTASAFAVEMSFRLVAWTLAAQVAAVYLLIRMQRRCEYSIRERLTVTEICTYLALDRAVFEVLVAVQTLGSEHRP